MVEADDDEAWPVAADVVANHLVGLQQQQQLLLEGQWGHPIANPRLEPVAAEAGVAANS